MRKACEVCCVVLAASIFGGRLAAAFSSMNKQKTENWLSSKGCGSCGCLCQVLVWGMFWWLAVVHAVGPSLLLCAGGESLFMPTKGF